MDLENTNFRARKNTQYNIARIMNIESQKNASNTIRKTNIKIVIPIQSKMDKNSPAIPSPISMLGKLGAVPALGSIPPVL